MNDGLEPRATAIDTTGTLTLPAATGRRLRLLRPEPFTVVGEGRHDVHLVRASVLPQSSLAAPRVTLSGRLEKFGISDLVSLLSMSRRSGHLLVIDANDRFTITFRRGEITGADSSRTEDRLRSVLERTGKVPAGRLAEIEPRATVDGDEGTAGDLRLGAALLERGWIETDDLRWAIRHQVEEIVYSVFQCESGSFLLFDLDSSLMDVESELAIDSNNLLLEAFRRMDEWTRIERELRRHGRRLTRTGRAIIEPLPERPARLLELVDGQRSLEDLVRACGWGEFTTYEAIYQLIRLGLVEGSDAEPDQVATDPELHDVIETVESYNRAFQLARDVLAAKRVEFDLQKLYAGFREIGSDWSRGVLQGVVPSTNGRLPGEAIWENALEMVKLAARQSTDLSRSAFTPLGVVRSVLAEWLRFQIAAIEVLLPAVEARELVTFLTAAHLSRSGR